ncbi:cysteine hydrolase [Pseudanabaena sp. FACHB-2040]|nr:cysteine hydrolase [Pseudanabaena sp. FACHB-2040]
MEQAFGLEIPQTLSEICQPQRIALLVYDMQVGILSQLPPERTQYVTRQVLKILNAAQDAGIRVFFSRHLSLPVEVAGVFQLRTAMAWQRITHVSEIKPWFLRDAPGFQLIPELKPRSSEVIFDKIAMSAFEGTLLNLALRDCGINALMIVGVATEVGIEPTARHAADLGYIPVVVTDACSGGNQEAAQRSIESLKFAGDAVITDTATLCELLK